MDNRMAMTKQCVEMATIFPKGLELHTLLSGFGFLEGPIWHPHDQYLIFSDIEHSTQYQWSEAGGIEVFRKPSNQANGNAFDANGRVVSCEHASSSVVRHEHGGRLVKALATHFEGHALNSPNDIVVDTLDRIWFTDPTFGRIREHIGILREEEIGHRGVYRIDTDGQLSLVADDLEQPNGLCFTPNGRSLLVNDSAKEHIRKFAITKSGALRGGEIIAKVVGDGPGVADGMKVDSDGRIYCVGPGGIHVFDADGVGLGLLPTPQQPTNLTFAGVDLNTLLITCKTAVYRIKTSVSGMPGF